MIGDLFFIVKISVFTLLIVIFLQVKVGKETVDIRIQNWLGDSVFVQFFEEAVSGALNVTKDGYKAANEKVVEVLKNVKKKHGVGDINTRGLAVSVRRYYQKDDGTVKENAQLPGALTDDAKAVAAENLELEP